MWPQVQNSKVCAKVQDWQHLPFIWPSAAPSFLFPTLLHLHVGLAKRVLQIYDLGRNPYKFLYPIEACMTSASASHPVITVTRDPWTMTHFSLHILAYGQMTPYV